MAIMEIQVFLGAQMYMQNREKDPKEGDCLAV